MTMSNGSARFTVEPSGRALGADIVGFPFEDFAEADVAAVRAAWIEHQVLRFRSTTIDDEIQLRFSRMIGPGVVHPRQLQEGSHGTHGEILVVSNLENPDGSPVGDLGAGEVRWHTDTWFKERPPAASILRALQVPEQGGNTCFCSMYATYESLPDELKSRIEGRLIHHQTVYDGRGDVRMGMTVPDSDDVRTWPGVDHPIVRTHAESGRRALYLGGQPRYSSIVGLPPAESRELLDLLWEHVGKEEFTWCQQWQPGDMVMWDNRCVVHRRDAFDPHAARLMHRTTAEGERPV
jgi:taurine dioxygenase